MMIDHTRDDRRLLGAGLIALGLAFAAAAGVWGMLAVQHMAWAAALCGPASGHCVRCVAAGAAALAAAATLAGGVSLLAPRQRPTASRIA